MPNISVTIGRDRETTNTNKYIWIKIEYHFHIFHYRMPGTAAISGITPFVPSPLTVKMAMIASLLQLGEPEGAQKLAENIHEIDVKIIPPKSAISFKALLRYRSPPAAESKEKKFDESGSYYPSRPHTREYTIFQGNLVLYIKSPQHIKDLTKIALKNIRYLGAKDSMVTCIKILLDRKPEEGKYVSPFNSYQEGTVALLADFKQGTQHTANLISLIPTNRVKSAFENIIYTIPGKVITKGRTKIFIANQNLEEIS